MYKIQNSSKYTITNITIVITILIYFIQTNIRYGALFLGLNLYFTEANFFWQPLSCIFAHGGLGHLGMNMLVLYQFGNPIEIYKGKKEFILVYFIGGILTSLLSFVYIYFLDNNVNLVGASGAICALMGYYAFFNKHERKGIIIWILIISIAPLLIGLPIAWYCHFIGLTIGFIFAILGQKN